MILRALALDYLGPAGELARARKGGGVAQCDATAVRLCNPRLLDGRLRCFLSPMQASL